MALSLAAANQLVAVKNDIDEKRKPKVYPKITVRLPEEIDLAIREIVDHSDDINSPSQAVRQALVVYVTLMQQLKQGNIGGVQMSDGTFIPLFDNEEDKINDAI